MDLDAASDAGFGPVNRDGAPARSLWRHGDFVKLWVGQTVSLGGSLIGRFSIPLVAVLTLQAGPADVALLRLAGLVPGVVVALLAGAWVDRLRRRPLMIWTDVGRALLFATIPAAALFGVLGIEQLVLVLLATGTLTTLFDVAYRSYLPTLLRRDQLVEGNSKLQASSAVVEVASFGGAGWLVQLVTAPIAILVDALSFLVSALALWRIRTPEPPPTPVEERRGARAAIREGLRFVAGHPLLRPLTAAAGLSTLFAHMWVSMLTLFLARDLAIEPGLLGMLYAIGGVTALLGASVADRVIARFGPGPTLVGCLLLSNLSLLFVPMAAGPLLVILLFVGAQQLFDAPAVVYEIGEASVIQATAPHHLLGRVVASHGFVSSGAMLAGTALGGVLGELIGARGAMIIGGVGSVLAVAVLAASPVRSLRAMPTPP
ncbi:MAG: MFS transporter [Chloroflexota bacterium]|nr:MFS transporter [Chloroflexota bacterium]